MKQYAFAAEAAATTTVANQKTELSTVHELKEHFLNFPNRTELRYGQDEQRRPLAKFVFKYENNTSLSCKVLADPELIEAVTMAVVGNFKPLVEYAKKEHEPEVLAEGENFNQALFKQYIKSNQRCYVEPDWFDRQGNRYRCVTFTPAFKLDVKFTVPATDEVNELIHVRCMPRWKRKAEGLNTVQQVG